MVCVLIEVGLGFIVFMGVFFIGCISLISYGARLEQRIQSLENEKEKQK